MNERLFKADPLDFDVIFIRHGDEHVMLRYQCAQNRFPKPRFCNKISQNSINGQIRLCVLSKLHWSEKEAMEISNMATI
jgi:hypothetical protein